MKITYHNFDPVKWKEQCQDCKSKNSVHDIARSCSICSECGALIEHQTFLRQSLNTIYPKIECYGNFDVWTNRIDKLPSMTLYNLSKYLSEEREFMSIFHSQKTKKIKLLRRLSIISNWKIEQPVNSEVPSGFCPTHLFLSGSETNENLSIEQELSVFSEMIYFDVITIYSNRQKFDLKEVPSCKSLVLLLPNLIEFHINNKINGKFDRVEIFSNSNLSEN